MMAMLAGKFKYFCKLLWILVTVLHFIAAVSKVGGFYKSDLLAVLWKENNNLLFLPLSPISIIIFNVL